MSHELLSKAVSLLTIQEIILGEANVRLDPSLNVHAPDLNLTAKMSEGDQVLCEQVSGKTPDGKDCRFIRLGFRFVLRLVGPGGFEVTPAEKEQGAPTIPASADENVKVTIEALLKGVYAVAGDGFPENEVVQAFIANAKFQVWPYWREFVTQMVARMNLPTVTIAPYQVQIPGREAQ